MDVLVIVTDPARWPAALDAWQRAATVTQQLPPSVALARVDGEVPDVAGTHWYTGDVPPDVLLALSPVARLFVAAWRVRQRPKRRPGDGVTWDTRGFRPPDMDV